MEIKLIDHIEFFVGNALQAAYYYSNALGFKQVAYMGPETGSKDVVSYVLVQGRVRFVFTSPLLPKHQMTDFLSLHGDAVKSIAFEVDDAKQAWDLALKNGAKSSQDPIITKDTEGVYISSAVLLYGDITLSVSNPVFK